MFAIWGVVFPKTVLKTGYGIIQTGNQIIQTKMELSKQKMELFNQEMEYFSNFQNLDQKSSFTQSFPFDQRIPKPVAVTRN